MVGNKGADHLAEQGSLSHPYNETRHAKGVAPDDQVLTRQDTDLPSHCSWVLNEYEGPLDEGRGGGRDLQQQWSECTHC